jgi:P2 family phage contractile tail tube protein
MVPGDSNHGAVRRRAQLCQADAPELSPPKLKMKTEDYRAGGMDAPVKIDQGMEGRQAAFSMGSVERDVLKFFGLADNNAFNATFRGASATRAAR